MQQMIFSELKTQYDICYLVKAFMKKDFLDCYVHPYGLDQDSIIALSIYQSRTKKKTPSAEIKQYIIDELAPELEAMGVKYLAVTDADYFKILAKVPKAEPNLGYLFPSEFGSFKVFYMPNYRTLFYNPEATRAKIEQATKAMLDDMRGNYKSPGLDIIHYSAYPKTIDEIKYWLDTLYRLGTPLTCDIEGFSLKHYECGIATISFAWDQHNGIAFPVDYIANPDGTFKERIDNKEVKSLLKTFFIHFAEIESLIFHNAAFDVNVLIYELFMDDLLDQEGLLEGISVFGKNIECSKLISYLATNTCAGNELSLKVQAQEYAGNYAQDDEDIKDVRRIPLPELLQYNLIDTLSTHYVINKNYPKVIKDNQLDFYQNIFRPGLIDVIQMQLTGIPINMLTVLETEAELMTDYNDALNRIKTNPVIQEFEYLLKEEWVIFKNNELKKKRVTIADATKIVFNPASPKQLAKLLFEFIGLPVISRTKTKAPSTDADTIKALKDHCENNTTYKAGTLDFLEALSDYAEVDKLITTYIPLLKAAQYCNGWHYIFGNFNLGGTKSGRLSSSNPNLQNLPASGNYGKKIKNCFQAPPGWVMTGLDFASLEDRISALTTKDPNKLDVYIQGYDGHSLRTFNYYKEDLDYLHQLVDHPEKVHELPLPKGSDLNQLVQLIKTDPSKFKVQIINSIEDNHSDLRKKSKAPTFALTYQGTYITLMRNCGFSEEEAKMIEARYHEMYKVSDKWVQSKLDQAAKDGYVTLAFGLRLRTPLLAQVVRGNSKTPYEADAEGRTAGNALGQSWCLLNTRASIEFMEKVRESKYRLQIKPIIHIHDAQYYLIRDDIDILQYTNTHLVKAAQWQDHPDIYHDQVKLGGNLSVFYPSWKTEIKLPNYASNEELLRTINEAINHD